MIERLPEKCNSRLPAVAKEWNSNDNLRKLMNIDYDGLLVIEKRGEQSVRSELIIMADSRSSEFLEELWTRIKTNIQTPLYTTRDRRENTQVMTDNNKVLHTVNLIEWFTWKDTMSNMEKVVAIENIVADALTKLKESVTYYIDRNQPIPNTAWDVI
ncbi:hypothetical protein ZJ62_08350 [Salmonella enterica subsp. enterica serovar Kentucky]|nr:hypothetical protein [Salmonella enterica subsp. enterica serovar Kentucky]